jgi:hypothetical protein
MWQVSPSNGLRIVKEATAEPLHDQKAIVGRQGMRWGHASSSAETFVEVAYGFGNSLSSNDQHGRRYR